MSNLLTGGVFKVIVHQEKKKLNIYTTSSHPRCRWVCFFIRFGEIYHSITCSPMDPLQWMGAVRMRVQTADKNITIHTTPVHQLTSWEDKNCMFVRNKSIIKTFLTSNCCFWLKYKSTSIIALPPVKSSSPVVSHIKIQPHICLDRFVL